MYWYPEYKVIRDAKAILFTSEKERLLARKSFWLYKANEKVVEYGTQAPPKESEVSKDIFLSKYSHLFIPVPLKFDGGLLILVSSLGIPHSG